MLLIAGAEGDVILRRRRRDQGIRDPESRGGREFFHIDRRPVPDIFRQGEEGEPAIGKERLHKVRIASVDRTLEKLHKAHDGQASFGILVDHAGRGGVAPENPDEDIGIIEHDASSGERR